MSTSKEFISFVCSSLPEEYSIRYKSMFGEYMVYVDEKPVFLITDNTVYVKKLNQLSSLLKDASTGVPYPGAKEHYILDIENRNLVEAILPILILSTPAPKKKK